ncbi:MAG: hypothetical protein J2P30_08865 [Actinobacteria bacterium]|nr:hypothetical protein [Actinomycetota bacterium]
MIRRLFWLVLGAVLGVTGYRKATAFARSLRPAPRASGLAEFAADVREGMALYMERQARPPASTLEGHRRAGLPPGSQPRAGLPRGGRGSSAHHHDEPKDGR